MTERRTSIVMYMLMGTIALALISNAVLLARVNELQSAVLLALGRPVGSSGEQGLALGTDGPPVQMATVDGRSISLSALRGSPVLFGFLSTTCSACQDAFEALRLFREEATETRIVVMCRGQVEELEQLSVDLGIPVTKWDENIVAQYEVPGTPFFYLLDKEGKVRNKGVAGSLERIREVAEVPVE